MTSQRLYTDLAWIWPLLSPPDHYAEEVSKIVAAFLGAGTPKGGSILHLGCGGGSVDLHLAKQFRVTGLDVSRAMLDHARSVNPGVDYVEGNMLDARLGRSFDGVLLHDAQAYLTEPEELRATYETAAAHLRPGGVLVSAPEELRFRFHQHRVTNSTLSDGKTTVTTIEIDYDPDPNDHAFEGTYLFLIRDDRGQRVEMDVHRVGLWDLEEVLAPMRAVGFAEPEVSTPKLSDMEEGEWVLVTAKKATG